MDRRRFLAVVGGGAVAGTAGCVGALSSDDEPPVDGAETTPSGDEQSGDEAEPPDEDPPAELTPSPDDLPWPMAQGDAAAVGVAPGPGPVEDPIVAWRSDAWGTTTTPVVDDGAAYYGTGLYQDQVHAYDLETGDRRWRADVDDQVEDSLAVAGGQVYVAAGSLYAFDAESGTEVWMEHLQDPEGVAVADGIAYTASRQRDVVAAYDARTGDQLWTAPISGIATPAVRDGVVYASSFDGVHALDAATGEIDWERSFDETVRVPPTVGEDRLYVTTRDWIAALDREDGDEVWSVEGRFRYRTPALADDRVYVAGRPSDGDSGAGSLAPSADRLVALDAGTGAVDWSTGVENRSLQDPVVADGLVYATDASNWLRAFDAADGEERWRVPLEWRPGTPAVVDGRVLVSAGGRLLSIAEHGDATPDPDQHPALDPPADPPVPEYPGSDLYFGTEGYDVTATAEASVDDGAPFEATLDVDGDAIDSDSEVAFAFDLENTGEEPLSYSTGAPRPLGVVGLRGVDGTEGSITAWTEAYEESGHVHDTPHRGVQGVNSIALGVELEPGERRQETYTLSTATHTIQPGTYEYETTQVLRIGDFLGGDDDEESWSLDLSMTADVDQPAPEAGDVLFDLAVADAVSPPAEFVGAFDVEVLEPVTDVHPGVIEIGLTNDSDERELIGSPRGWPFGAFVGRAPDGSRLVLITAEMFAPAYVRGEGASRYPAFLPHVESRRGWSLRGIDAGETFTRQYLVLAHPEDAPLSAGTYTFKKGYADRTVEFPWGVALSVLDPE